MTNTFVKVDYHNAEQAPSYVRQVFDDLTDLVADLHTDDESDELLNVAGTMIIGGVSLLNALVGPVKAALLTHGLVLEGAGKEWRLDDETEC